MKTKIIIVLVLLSFKVSAQSFLKYRLEFFGRSPENKTIYVGNNIYTGLEVEKKIGFDKSYSFGLFYRGYFMSGSTSGLGEEGDLYSSDIMTYIRDYHLNDNITRKEAYDEYDVIKFHYVSVPIAFKYYITNYLSVQYRAGFNYLISSPRIKGDKYSTPLQYDTPNKILVDNSLTASLTLFGRLDCMVGYTYTFNSLIQKQEYTYSYMKSLDIKPSVFFVGCSVGLYKFKTKKI